MTSILEAQFSQLSRKNKAYKAYLSELFRKCGNRDYLVSVLSSSSVVLFTLMTHGLLVMYTPLIVDIELGHVTCFGQWNAPGCDVSRECGVGACLVGLVFLCFHQGHGKSIP